jgi:hypothetical protein
MTTEMIFIAGAFIFSGTVYGAVMVGSFVLQSKMVEEEAAGPEQDG